MITFVTVTIKSILCPQLKLADYSTAKTSIMWLCNWHPLMNIFFSLFGMRSLPPPHSLESQQTQQGFVLS